eukprot:gnl/Spiro4/1083_TR562_c0_g1_i1.p1 gnl/Spiro4/1083_TR562_c0_g1~~gnl/Spiro4/1083_TR562_c0_g1_i1.p1  ORF type:complete len:289 (+),score=51.03 gnl/Spiro4/1083_TR562_c0_g1_i1:75-941(+)
MPRLLFGLVLGFCFLATTAAALATNDSDQSKIAFIKMQLGEEFPPLPKETFPAGFGGFGTVLPPGHDPVLPTGSSLIGDGPDISAAHEETNGDSDEDAVTGPLPPIYHEDRVELHKQRVGFAGAVLRTAAASGKAAIGAIPASSEGECTTSHSMADIPFARPFRCTGCLATLASLSAFLRAVGVQPLLNSSLTDTLSASSHDEHSHETLVTSNLQFIRSCGYVESDYIRVCEYLYNVHGHHIIDLVLRNRVPLHVCRCVNFCETADVALFKRAFVPLNESRGVDVVAQ